ncbi:response regulator transcription factor [Chitinophaga rhizophila]|uniref:Response regulator transcription factor n=1 Tax=Chitinophaga rhizophila TaxID=2866212 RepID=A0ABS7GKR0_9BACT|nr:response regulator transcription factor [Chitinophaga rhizophila]MBW8687227.1 response regulator transcription factor [Chitinophaga rhizophila]
MKTISLAILDKTPLFAKMLRKYLSEQPGMSVEIISSGFDDLTDRLHIRPVDVLIMDISFPDYLEQIKTLRVNFPQVNILILSMCTDLQVVSELQDLGIYGYISKADDGEELVYAIRMIAGNDIFRNKLFTEALYLNRRRNMTRENNESMLGLNEREKMVVQLMWEEKTNKEIADELFLSTRSIEKIRQDIRDRLGLKSTVGLLKYALYNRIIHLNTNVIISSTSYTGN